MSGAKSGILATPRLVPHIASLMRATDRGLSCPQRGFERRASRRIVEVGIVVGERLRALDVQRGEHRPVLLEHVRGLLLEIGEFRELVHMRITGRARHGGELDPGVRDRVRTVRLVGSVLDDDMDEILRRRRGDGDQRSEVHQQAAVALQTNDAPVGPAQRQSEGVRRIEPHRAHREVVERALPEFEPVDGGTIGRDHGLVGDVPRKRAETLIPLHHAAEGLRPINRASGCDAAYASSIAGRIFATSASALIRWCGMPMASRIGSMMRTPQRGESRGVVLGSCPSSPIIMQIGWRYSTATPRMALMESRKPVDWISVSARLSQYERPEAMPMHSSSLQTRMGLNAGSREMGRSSPPLVTMSGTERMNSTPLALRAAMMLEPLSSISSSSAVSKSASIRPLRCRILVAHAGWIDPSAHSPPAFAETNGRELACVTRGLDPRVHHSSQEALCEEDGWPGQARP